ncbi:Hsp20/alpha crystallin family protein [Candidatus Woesearchaeota archaeon]|jgi:HSP20 family protein|nr:Hsp20/alpha crystallin family protein [Candidatus Woesearchaeota archaeon]
MFEDFFEEMKKLQLEIDKSFRNFFESENQKYLTYKKDNSQLSLFRNPVVDLEEKDKEIIVRFEIPGVDKKDIELNLNEKNVELKVEKKEESRIEKKGILKEEKNYKRFYKSISLPSEIVVDKTKAKYKDGVLELVMPKKESNKKKIEIE